MLFPDILLVRRAVPIKPPMLEFDFDWVWCFHFNSNVPVRAFLFFRQFEGFVHRPNRKVIAELGWGILHLLWLNIQNHVQSWLFVIDKRAHAVQVRSTVEQQWSKMNQPISSILKTELDFPPFLKPSMCAMTWIWSRSLNKNKSCYLNCSFLWKANKKHIFLNQTLLYTRMAPSQCFLFKAF